MVQQGQTIELTRRGSSGERLWAYRYRIGGRDSKRARVRPVDACGRPVDTGTAAGDTPENESDAKQGES